MSGILEWCLWSERRRKLLHSSTAFVTARNGYLCHRSTVLRLAGIIRDPVCGDGHKRFYCVSVQLFQGRQAMRIIQLQAGQLWSGAWVSSKTGWMSWTRVVPYSTFHRDVSSRHVDDCLRVLITVSDSKVLNFTLQCHIYYVFSSLHYHMIYIHNCRRVLLWQRPWWWRGKG